MSEHIDIVYLRVIYDSVNKIEKYIEDYDYEKFYNNDQLIDSVLMNLIVIGEEANKLSEEFKDAHIEIDWFRLRGLRNRIVHDYPGTNLNIVWSIIKNDLPVLKDFLIKEI